MKITVEIEKNDRKQHMYSSDCRITFEPKLTKPDMEVLRAFILASVDNWFDEYIHQPTASQLHPL